MPAVHWRSFEDEAQELDEESLFLWMRAHPFDDLVVLDVTASEELAGQYLDFASYGFHVIQRQQAGGCLVQRYLSPNSRRLRQNRPPLAV